MNRFSVYKVVDGKLPIIAFVTNLEVKHYITNDSDVLIIRPGTNQYAVMSHDSTEVLWKDLETI